MTIHTITFRPPSLQVAAVLFTLAATPLPAQTNYMVDWFTVDGGGGMSSGGGYTITGTIGQPDAGPPMSGGSFTLVGGFWALPAAVQTPGAPVLTITHAGPAFVGISWSPPTPGFVLQFCPTLSPPAWTNAPTGATNPVTLPDVLAARFYRLKKD